MNIHLSSFAGLDLLASAMYSWSMKVNYVTIYQPAGENFAWVSAQSVLDKPLSSVLPSAGSLQSALENGRNNNGDIPVKTFS